MNALTRFVLDHKRLVVAFWLAVTVAAFAALGPAGRSLSPTFSLPGREGFETNKELAATYGNGGDVAPIVPVVQLPPGKTVDSPGVREERDAALAKVKAALPEARPPPTPRRATVRSSPTTGAPPSPSSTSRPEVVSTRDSPRRGSRGTHSSA